MSLLRRRVLRFGIFGSLALVGSAAWVVMNPPASPPADPFNEALGNLMPDPNRASPLPAIALPGLDGGPGFTSAEIVQSARPVLLNIFASWCAPCIIEAPILNTLHQEGVTIWGIAFRDRPEAIAAFLARHGNPYARIGFDPNSQHTAPLGLSGVPENLLVDGTGIVRWRWPAGITEEIARQTILPRWRAMV
jgi:cytochrome c biogenesis protein CcmG/thiol:disulfide interchange protein DsbE